MVRNGKRKTTKGLKDLILNASNKMSDRHHPLETHSARLSSKILAIVAEHLTGQLAFGSVASLNRACKAVNRETLPVLWETFFFSHDPLAPEGKAAIRNLSEGIKHTKYIFFQTEVNFDADIGRGGDFEHLERMPNIVMTIASDSGEMVTDPDESWIRLYRPVSSSTVFRILGTPFHQAVIVDHAACSLMHRSFARAGMQARECRAQALKPALRPLATIQNMTLVNGAYLHDRPPHHLAPIKTNLRLFNGNIVSTVVNARHNTRSSSFDSKAIVTTLVELMKLPTRQKTRAHTHNAEMEMLMREQMMMIARYPACVSLPVWKEWHASIDLDKAGVLDLMKELRVLARDTPQILQYRLNIVLTEPIGKDTCLDMLNQFANLYTANIGSIEDDLLPCRTEVQTVLRCECIFEEASSSGNRGQGKPMCVTVELSERRGGVSAKVRAVKA